jgi:type I restriction enzyme M protein
MLSQETKKHIDNARQILVGVVPNPSSQIDQITNALIYKFMDDMDQASIKIGGNPSFFIDDLEKYSWTKLMDQKIGNQEKMNLYSEALQKFSLSPQLPELFRTIFKSAFLPYRSPETLGLFLTEINYFDYSHSEELGNAYEYLLSIMSSQGDAGQFRTPRHIIEFIVDVLNPSKDDKILDPACGTGGFLVSAYKHILEQHDGKDDPEGKEKPLTPDQKRKMMQNFEGYDIDPTMARIAQVNMYLHQFKNPKIIQYDSLSQDEFWHDKFDVILANPPFMSPKGGIKPHNKFSIESNRSEVLFVDYIANHLKPQGRAGIIVPEGVIFQSGIAYKTLRKNLIENGLYAVISLPSGVFQPYSGVKTSILLIDKEFAKKSNEILFIKIENDGFDLGAQRRVNVKNDLPQALEILQKFKNHFLLESPLALNATDLNNSPLEGVTNVRSNHPPVESLSNIRCNHPPLAGGSKLQSNFGEGSKNFLLVPKSKIAENGDYNLSGDRYRIATDYSKAKWEMVELGEVCDVFNGSTPKRTESQYWENGTIPWFTIDDIRKSGRIISSTQQKITQKGYKESSVKLLPKNTVLLCCTASVGEYAYSEIELTTNQQFNGLVVKKDFIEKLNPKFLYWCSSTFKDELDRMSGKATFGFVSVGTLKKFKIPLPPLEIQEQIVSEVEGYSAIITGAKQIVANWKPKIDIDPSWEMVELGEVCDVIAGQSPEGEFYNDVGNGMPFYQGKTEFTERYIGDPKKWTTKVTKIAEKNDILMSVRAPVGPVNIATQRICIGRGIASIRTTKASGKYVFELLRAMQNLIKGNSGATFDSINKSDIEKIKIPLPPLETQQQIVSQIEAERALVESAKKLIEIYEQKTKAVINKLWEE